MAKIAIIGAGVMGAAMSVPAAAMGHEVALIGTHLDRDIIHSVAGNGWHPRLGLTLPAAVTAYQPEALSSALNDETALVIIGVASAGIGWAAEQVAANFRHPIPVLMLTKGLTADGETIEILPSVFARALSARTGLSPPVMAVGGPCIAGELAAGRETGVVVTGADMTAVERVTALLAAPFYHARTSQDVVGVEFCAALKNFFALGVGTAAGELERAGKSANGALMHNRAASLFSQAVAEMAEIVQTFGGDVASVHGMAGVGDLYVTCQAGRNSRMGRLLGLGLRYQLAKREHMAADTVEGAELAFTVGPTFEHLWRVGRLPAARMPLARAIVAAVCRDEPFAVDPADCHRRGRTVEE